MKRTIERLFLRLVFWAFSLTELPPTDEVCSNPDCVPCRKKRAKRRN